MKRTLLWRLPILVALVSGCIFAWGFYLLLSGDLGEPVGAAGEPVVRQTVRPGRELRIILLGDSLARGTGDPTGLGIGGALDAELSRRGVPHRHPVNVAVNGAHTADLLRQLDSANLRMLIADSDVVIVSVGGNDLFGSGTRQAPPPDPARVIGEVQERIERIVGGIRKVNPSGRIYLVGLYNPFAATPAGRAATSAVNLWNSGLMERFASDPSLVLVQTADLFAHRDLLSVDRFHPGTEGYRLIAMRISESL